MIQNLNLNIKKYLSFVFFIVIFFVGAFGLGSHKAEAACSWSNPSGWTDEGSCGTWQACSQYHQNYYRNCTCDDGDGPYDAAWSNCGSGQTIASGYYACGNGSSCDPGSSADSCHTYACSGGSCVGTNHPVDGTSAGLSDWGTCSKTCGGGTQTRTCTGYSCGGDQYCGVGLSGLTQNCNTQACPSVLTANISVGATNSSGSFTVTWSSSISPTGNAWTCSISGGGIITYGTSGTATGSISGGAPTTVQAVCLGITGSVTGTYASATAQPYVAPPVVTLSATNANSSHVGSFSWTVSGSVTSCSGFVNPGSPSVFTSSTSAGSASVTLSSSGFGSYSAGFGSFWCSGPGGSSNVAYATISDYVPPPTVSFWGGSVDSSQHITVGWSSTGASSCTGGGYLFSATATSGSQSLVLARSAFSSTGYGVTSWSMYCSNAGGNSTVAYVTAAPYDPAVCGTANGKTRSSAPSTDAELCSNGYQSVVSGSGPWTWSCALSTVASCSASLTPSMSGTLSSSYPSCGISAGSSSCSVDLTWSTSNPAATSAITSNGSTVFNGNSGTAQAVSIPYNTRTFYLYNNGSLLAQTTPTSFCVANTTWNGSICALNTYSVNGTAGTGGTISPGTRTVSYGSTTTFTVTASSNYTIASVSGCGGSLSVNTYTTGVITGPCTVTASFSLIPVSGNLSASPTSCTIVAGASSCNVTLTWSTSNPIGTSAVTASGMTDVNGNTGSQAFAVPYPSRTFYLYNVGYQIGIAPVTSDCISGTAWDVATSKCKVNPISVTMSASPTTKTVVTGASTSTTLTWITTGTPDSCTATTSGAWTGAKVASGGSEVISNLSSPGTYSYTITCSKAGASNDTSTATFALSNMSGSITPSANSCTISLGASTCSVNLSWSTTNPIAVSAVTASGMTDVNANSGVNQAFTVTYPSRAFYLYNNSSQLDTKTITASCVAGTGWDVATSKCKANLPVVGIESPSGSSVTGSIQIKGYAVPDPTTSINRIEFWTASTPVLVASSDPASPSYYAGFGGVTRNDLSQFSANPAFPNVGFLYPNFNTTSLSNGSHTLTIKVFDNAGNSTVVNLPITVTNPSGSITPSAASCIIPSGASTCNVTLTWSTTSPVTTSAVTAVGMTDVNANLGVQAFPVPYSSRIFYLYNNAVLLGQTAITSACAANTVWNGTICADVIPTGTLTAAQSSCTIALSKSTCTVLFTWDTTNPIGISAVTNSGNTSPIPQANSATNVSLSVPYGGNTFFLYNNAVLLAQKAISSSCSLNTKWNGVDCEAINLVSGIDLTASDASPSVATVNVPVLLSAIITNQGLSSTGVGFSNFFQVSSASNGGGTITDLSPIAMAVLTSGNNLSMSKLYTFTSVGTYSVRACADKTSSAGGGVITESDENNNCGPWSDVSVTALANSSPAVNAGIDQVLTTPTSSTTITGTAFDSDGTIASTSWVKISGPTGGNIVTPNSLTTNITGLVVGTYVFRLTATDNLGSPSSAQMRVTVNNPGLGGFSVPTVTLTAQPLTLYQTKTPTLIQWSSTNSDSCVGSSTPLSYTKKNGTVVTINSPFNVTLPAVIGSTTVNPPVTTDYTVTCSGSGGVTSKTITVKTVFPDVGEN
ncbi:MAG: hypothetical protein WCK91_00455 [bacterium]